MHVGQGCSHGGAAAHRGGRGTRPEAGDRGSAIMYLFSRRARLAGGHGTAGVEWAVGIAGKVTEITGHQVQVWANAYSPGYGTVTWTAWFEDLTALEAMGDQLVVEPSYMAMADAGAGFTDGSGLDDGVMQPIHGEPDPERPIEYVSGASAIVAGGSFERAIGAGIELVEHGERVTGIPAMFLRALTGPYGLVGWLTGYENMAQMEAAMDAQAADPDWLKLIDSTKGAFVEQVGATETTIYRKLN